MNSLKQQEVQKASDIQENDMEEYVLEELSPKEIYAEGTFIKSADLCINEDNRNGITLITGEPWYVRLWYLLSNPFRYLFTGKMRY